MGPEFPAQLRAHLDKNGISQRAFARQVPIDAGQFSRILNGKRRTPEGFARRCDDILQTGNELFDAAMRDQNSGTGESSSWSPRNELHRDGRRASGDVPAGETSLGEQVRVWNIPSPVLGFVGRDRDIDAVHRSLARQRAHDGNLAAVAVHGIAGVGKTQLARAFAQSRRVEYSLGWWLSAETPLDVTVGLNQLALRLGAPANLLPAEVLPFLSEQLNTRASWLLIFDNATTPVEVAPFMPGGHGHIIFTSRNPSWRLLADPIAVDVLDLQAATDLLTDRGVHESQEAARALAHELGQLPLAIGQAAAYAADTNISVGEYLRLFRQEQARLLARGSALAYPGNVSVSVALAVAHLASTSTTARRLLEICALCSPDPLPIGDLLCGLTDLPGTPSGTESGSIEQLDVRRALRQSGLLITEENDDARLHRLTRLIIEDRMDNYPERVREAVHLLATMFPTKPSEPATWAACGRLAPHARAVLSHAQRQDLNTEAQMSLLTRVGRYLLCSGLSFKEARNLHTEALRLRRFQHDGDHPETARCIVHLAVDLNELGETERARELHEEALAMRRRLLPGDHPDVAHSLDNLGNVLHILGDFEQARDYHDQGLLMRRSLYPQDDPNLAYSLSNLAADLHKLGDPDGARTLNESALAMRRRLNPGDHPDTAHSLSSLAADLHALGEYDLAADLEQRSLAMRRRLYPAGHPNLVRSLLSLAENRRLLGQHTESELARKEADQLNMRLAQQGA